MQRVAREERLAEERAVRTELKQLQNDAIQQRRLRTERSAGEFL
jgi:hypothetical protein